MTDLAFTDAVDQAKLVADGEAAPEELVESAIERIERIDPQLNAVIHPLFERAQKRVAAGLPDGPFRGVPVLIKDHDGFLEGAPFHSGNRVLRDAEFAADHTSHLFERLEHAGFVIVGKTNTPEFGLLPTAEPEVHGPTRNPWNLDHSAGGSSGGSAAAVAAGLVPVAHAGDGGGSIRIPSSMCALFGLKPSRGRVSLGPAEGEDWGGLVQRHVVTRTVRDSAAVLDALEGHETGDPYSAPPPARLYAGEVSADPGRLRIGIRTTASGGIVPTDARCVAATERLARVLESQGHTVEAASPAALDDVETVLNGFTAIAFSHTLAKIQWVGETVGRELTADDVEPNTWAQAEMARGMTGADYVKGRDGLHRWSRAVVSWWHEDGWDLLLTPTLAETPPPIGTIVSTDEDPMGATGRATPFGVFTVPFNATGQPAMSIPVDWTDDGLPVGVQVVAGQFREDVLLRVASQLEGELDWAARIPPVRA